MKTCARIVTGMLLAAAVQAATAGTLTWDNPINIYWSTVSSNMNWTADGGATHTAWVQTNDAVFVGVKTNTLSGGYIQVSSLIISNATAGTFVVNKKSGNDADRFVFTNAATIIVPTGVTLTAPWVDGSVGLTLDGGGTFTPSTPNWSGGIWVRNGAYVPGNNFGSMSGPYVLLDTQGTANATARIQGVNKSWSNNNPIVVLAGSSGKAYFENSPSSGTAYSPEIAGAISLSNTLQIGNASGKISVFRITGAIRGPGNLEIKYNNNMDGSVLSGSNTAHTGSLSLLNPGRKTGITNSFNGIQGTCNILVDTNVTVNGSGTLRYNIAGDSADLITLKSANPFTLNDLTLEPVLSGTQSISEFAIVNTTNGVKGTFASINNRYPKTKIFAVDYDGTALNPGKVVLTVSAAPSSGTMVIIR